MSYYHLNIDERCCIYNLNKNDMSIREIAKALHRAPSTISREINRNKIETGSRGKFYRYYPHKAQHLYRLRRTHCHRKSIQDEKILNYIKEIIDRISYIRTPEITSERYREELYHKAMDKYDEIEWIKLIKTIYIRIKRE